MQGLQTGLCGGPRSQVARFISLKQVLPDTLRQQPPAIDVAPQLANGSSPAPQRKAPGKLLKVAVITEVPAIELALHRIGNLAEFCRFAAAKDHQFVVAAKLGGDKTEPGMMACELRVFAQQMIPPVIQLEIDRWSSLASGMGGLLVPCQSAFVQILPEALFVRQDVIGFLKFMKFMLRLASAIWLPVRMILLRQGPVCGFDNRRIRIRRHAQDGKVILARIKTHLTPLTQSRRIPAL